MTRQTNLPTYRVEQYAGTRRARRADFICDTCIIPGAKWPCRCLDDARSFAAILGPGAVVSRRGVVLHTEARAA